MTVDDLRGFPSSLESVRATRLGNALTAMESWSRDRYHLDSQLMWYELQGVSNDQVRRDTDEGRAPVDFFVSAIANMLFLSAAALATAFMVPEVRLRAAIIGVLAALSMPASYHLAVRNLVDWAQSTKAMVNLGRLELAKALGLDMPKQLEDERKMWAAHYWAVEINDASSLTAYNSFRRSPEAQTGEGN